MQIKEVDVEKTEIFSIGRQYSHNVLVIHFVNLPNIKNKYIYYKIDDIEEEIPLVSDLFIVSRPLTMHSGKVKAQIIVRDEANETIGLTKNFTMIIKASNYSGIGEDENYPDDLNIKNYFVKIDEKVNSFEELANLVQTKLDNGEFIGAQGPKGDPGDVTEEYRNLAMQIAQNASDAQTSATNAQVSATAARKSLDDAKEFVNQTKSEMNQIKNDTSALKEEANTSATNAQKALDDAKEFVNQTKTELNQIKTDTSLLKEEANTSATNAKASETKAKEYADNLQASTDDISQLKEDIGKKLDSKADYVEQEISVIKGALINSLEHTQYNSPTMENATIPVIAGEKYRVKGWSINTTYCGLALYDGKNTTRIISNTGAFDTKITIPDGITTMHINGRTADNPISVSKFETTDSDSFWLEHDLLVEKTKDTERRVNVLEHKEGNYAVCKYGVNHISDGVIDVFLHKYDDTHDLNIGFKKKSGNHLPDFFVWQVFENTSNNVLIDKTGLVVTRTISQGYTDYLSPSTVYAANNGDGDFSDFTSGKLTGGWHMYNSKTSGDYTATARNISCKVYCDGKEIPVGETARGNEVIVDIVNRLQGSNTEKSDGTGREIVEQHFRIIFGENHKVVVDGEITALEDVLYANYYGVSYYFYNPQRTLPCFLVGDEMTRGGVLPSVNLHRSDDKCNAIRTITDTDVFEMGIDNSVDLGSFRHNRGWNMQISSLKAYPMLIMQTEQEKYLSIPQGGKAFWRGYYNCYPTISVN